METSLHRQLKEIYCGANAKQEVPLGDYRIDVINGEELVEIQHGSLAAIRDKVKQLLQNHRVRVVKPLVVLKRLVKRQSKTGRVVDRRLSPKRGSVLDLFNELVYFTQVFPHPNLTLETPLVEIEEWRYPGHGRRRRWRKNDFEIEDQKLIEVQQVHYFSSAADLINLLPPKLPVPFHTLHLAQQLDVDRSIAQRVAYCLLHTGAAVEVGKKGNTRLYELAEQKDNHTA